MNPKIMGSQSIMYNNLESMLASESIRDSVNSETSNEDLDFNY